MLSGKTGALHWLFFFSVFLDADWSSAIAQDPKKDANCGTVVAVGGGGVPEGLLKSMIEMAGGTEIRVVVLPQASQSENRGQDAAQEFRDQGAICVEVLELDDPAAAKKTIAAADLIWFSGGDQSKLIAELDKIDLQESIHERLQAGAVVGGTSAGAAVMSSRMIIDSPEVQAIRSGNTPMGTGLGLTQELIIDQHFIERERLNRLLSALIDHPDLLGVGIGERTAIIVQNEQIRVFGDGSVIILDARGATIEKAETGQLQSARKIQTHVLRAGDIFSLQPTDR